jgi:hypothetical protein
VAPRRKKLAIWPAERIAPVRRSSRSSDDSRSFLQPAWVQRQGNNHVMLRCLFPEGTCQPHRQPKEPKQFIRWVHLVPDTTLCLFVRRVFDHHLRNESLLSEPMLGENRVQCAVPISLEVRAYCFAELQVHATNEFDDSGRFLAVINTGDRSAVKGCLNIA